MINPVLNVFVSFALQWCGAYMQTTYSKKTCMLQVATALEKCHTIPEKVKIRCFVNKVKIKL